MSLMSEILSSVSSSNVQELIVEKSAMINSLVTTSTTWLQIHSDRNKSMYFEIVE